jgi:hypothetical protein
MENKYLSWNIFRLFVQDLKISKEPI